MYLYMCVCTYMYRCSVEGRGAVSTSSLVALHFLFLRSGLSLNLELTDFVYWLANMLLRLACLCPPSAGVVDVQVHVGFSCGSWRTGSHAGAASALTADPSLEAQKRDFCRRVHFSTLEISFELP